MNISTDRSDVIRFTFGQQAVRTVLIDDQPWFVASDIAAALQYSEAKDMTRNLDDDEKGRQIVPTPGGDQSLLVINESGLYSAILRSRKVEAKQFKKWVTAEVLPAIRKHGRYVDTEGKMGELCGALGLQRFRDLKRSKVSHLPAELQRKAMARIGQDLNIAFGVRSAAEIPASKIEAACTFIGAYALEGEWLGKVPGASDLAFHYPIALWKEKNPRQFNQDDPRSKDLRVDVCDLLMAGYSPCLDLLDKLHNAGHCVDGAFYEFRSYQNHLRRLDILVRGALGAINQAVGSLDRGRQRCFDYPGAKEVAA